uniref:Ig-like domain-containing protein n=1 Tax=Oreochromis aureus TaxID=47969 RepID=A0AAZ1XRU4_OREAU
MGATLLCELGLFLLCTLLCTGHAQDAVLTIEPSWSSFFIGEFVTFKCDMNEGKDTDWWYRISRDGREFLSYRENKDSKLEIIYADYSGEYQCTGEKKISRVTKNSNTVSVTVLADKARATLTAGTTIIPVGGSVTLTCSVQSSDGWKYEWFRRTQRTSEVQIRDQQNRDIRVSQGGIYSCRGTRGNPVYYTDISDDVTIEITFSNKVVVKQQPNWPQIFRGETITLTCEVQEGGETTEWEYEWRGPSTPTQWTHNNDVTFRVSESSSGDYMCKSRHLRDDSYSSTEWSEAFTLSASTASEPESSSFLTPLIVGLVCGILLILLLLLLCRFKQSKDSFFTRTRSTNQSSAMNHMIKDEAQHSRHTSTLQGDACVYESIKDHDDTQNDDSVLYAQVSHDKTKKDNDDTLLYAQVYYNKAKPKRHKD